jgi:hypothetical protein
VVVVGDWMARGGEARGGGVQGSSELKSMLLSLDLVWQSSALAHLQVHSA